MQETVYSFHTPLKIALLSDLHDRRFEWVVKSLRKHKPDMICIAGDVVHRPHPIGNRLVIRQTKYALPFLRLCAKIAPSFYSLGNHEWRLSTDDLNVIADTGVTLLDNAWCEYNHVLIGGLTSAGVTAYRDYRRDKPERYPEWHFGDRPDMTEPKTAWLRDFCAQSGYRILMCHHPEYRDRYLKNMPIDLVLSGHAHGGQICLFGQGLFAPGQGFLPKYTSGIHGNLIISRGLSNTGGSIPRLFNPTEIVYIEPNAQTRKNSGRFLGDS